MDEASEAYNVAETPPPFPDSPLTAAPPMVENLAVGEEGVVVVVVTS